MNCEKIWLMIWPNKDLLLWVFGILIGCAVSWFFYKKSGEQLIIEAEKLRKLTTMLVNGLDKAGLMGDVKRDKDGNPESLEIRLKADAKTVSTVTATLQ